MRFVHTADWQLGMTRHFLAGEAQPRYSAARRDAVAGLGPLATDAGAEFVVVSGDVFEHNQLAPAVISQSLEAMRAIGIPVYLLPGNHDPLTPDSVYRRYGLGDLPQVYVSGLTTAQAVEFPAHELEIWGHAHLDYDNMVPLRSPRPRSTRWQIALAHGHYEADGVPPLRPSWLISDAEIEATGADYVALGHWNRPAQVGNGRVPAYYSGSPDLAGTVNVVRLGAAEGVVVTREKLRCNIAR